MNPTEKPILSLEERICCLDLLLEATLWGPHLHDKTYRSKVASHLHMCLDAAQLTQSIPPAVQSALADYVDLLGEIDRVPAALMPFAPH